LALGGLGNAWGAGVFEFDDQELADWPIRADDLRPHYDAVAARIGVAAATDDLTPFIPRPTDALPPLEVDTNAQRILDRYERQRERLNRGGFYMGRVPLAVCTQKHDGRGPQRYGDMDFWSDGDRSVYRPRFTVEQLMQSAAFHYVARQLVLRFSESNDGVDVTARNVDTGAITRFAANALVIAAGTLGTTRIALRSLGAYDARVPLLCNPYTYAPVLNWPMVGAEAADRRHSLAQISAVFQPQRGHGARGSVQVQFYSYRSLLTFRLLGETPLPYAEALRTLRLLMPALGILGINHDDSPSPARYCELQRGDTDERDVLRVHYDLAEDEQRRIDRNEREVLRNFRRLGVWPLKRVRPPHGSSIHYAGTLPMTRDGNALTTQRDGLLRGTRAVYIADGSVFPYLPAKGLTFTIMAHANRVATIVDERLPR
jgi:choline dehydrogenase-like flavoprotein